MRRVNGAWAGRKNLLDANRFRVAFEYVLRGLDFIPSESHLTSIIRLSLTHKNAPQVSH